MTIYGTRLADYASHDESWKLSSHCHGSCYHVVVAFLIFYCDQMFYCSLEYFCRVLAVPVRPHELQSHENADETHCI